MELTGVLISTTAERFPAMRRFYLRLLRVPPRSDRPGFINFDFGHSRLTVTLHDGITGPAADPLRIMVNLRTGDIQAAVARCDPDSVIRRPEVEKWGGWVATVADPDGNLVQFLQME
ncbi:MAG TPA: VOC family protein [Acidimicrobiia bacterium]|nr:VOC family protein [Acidimicrobiia bacterium]